MDRLLRKSFVGEVLEVQPGRRQIVACISTAAVDRDGEVVLPAGLLKKNYAGLTVFYNHDTTRPVGVAQWVKTRGDRVLAKYRCTDRTQFARDVFALAQDGVLTSYSVGFAPREASGPTPAEIAERPELATVRRMYRRWELLEFSLVGIPANPEATMLAISKKVSPETWAVLQPSLDGGGHSPALERAAPHDSTRAKVLAGAPAPRHLSSAEIAALIAGRLQPPDWDTLLDRILARHAGQVE